MKLFFLLLLVPIHLLAQPHSLSGAVLDAESLQPLPSATIRIIGSTKGTITNKEGYYRFSVPPGTITLAASYLGYETDTVTIAVTGSATHSFRLRPTAIQLAGVTVTDEDPAYEIVRRAIENKKKWMAQLRTFEAQAFTRTQLRSDSSIAAIIESYSLLYWNRNDSLREVIVQRRQTGNLPPGMFASRVGEVMNFNDDSIRQGGFLFLGPTAPNAFDYYDYQLIGTRSFREYDVYDIRLIPRSVVVPLFRGTISIASRSYAVVNVDLQANEAFSIPFVTIKRMSYTQSFRLVENKFWLPVNFRNESRLSISIMGIALPVIDVEKDIVLYDYRLNDPFPDSVARMNKVTIDSSATQYDSSFWASHDVLPLTMEQDSAYRTLDSTQTLEKKFAPTGAAVTALSFLGPVGVADLWFNRVEGFHVGVSQSFDSVAVNALSVRGSVGYGLSDKKWKYSGGLTFRFGDEVPKGTSVSPATALLSRTRFSLSGEVYDQYRHLPHVPFAGFFFNSVYALVDKNDFYDYFRTRGLHTSLTYSPHSSVLVTAVVTTERHYSLYQHTTFAWFARDKQYRPHRTIVEGRMNNAKFSVRYNPFGMVAFVKDAVTLQAFVDHASSMFSGTFAYTQVMMKMHGKVSTMLRREVPMPPSLDIYITGGMTDGSVPPQRYYTPETNVIGFGAAGTLRGVRTREFFGDNFMTVTVEHNFRRTVLSSIPVSWLKESNLEVIIGGTLSQYWLSRNVLRSAGFPATGMNGWYFEAGIGLQNILDVFRLDLTRRFASPQSWTVTVTASDILSSFLPEE